ncbi:MAG TPA: hypothetical protein VEC12_06300 [Bacteroidia bacterium]|nr:hypothetical protein [Bacteroidia bacterium]
MKWAYSIKNKITISVLLLFVLGMVFVNNRSERNSAEQLDILIHSIYSDRLMVENYIYELSENMHAIIELTSQEDISEAVKGSRVNAAVHKMKLLNASYSKTVFTPKEDTVFMAFTGMCHSIYLHSLKHEFNDCSKIAGESLALLDTLSAIQVSEAKAIMSKTTNIFDTGKAYSQFEMVLLVIIALIIQALILASPRLIKSTLNQKQHLN